MNSEEIVRSGVLHSIGCEARMERQIRWKWGRNFSSAISRKDWEHQRVIRSRVGKHVTSLSPFISWHRHWPQPAALTLHCQSVFVCTAICKEILHLHICHNCQAVVFGRTAFCSKLLTTYRECRRDSKYEILLISAKGRLQEPLAHCCAMFLCHLEIDDRHQYPMSNNKDHLVGQLTTGTSVMENSI